MSDRYGSANHLPMTYREASLRSAFARGQPGFAGLMSRFSGQVLINVALLEDWDARDFVVTLKSLTYGEKNPADAVGLVAGVPPDNQIGTFQFVSGGAGTPAEQSSYDILGLYMRVSWGSGNMRETAYVSYPYGGGSFQLHAGAVRIELPQGFDATAPLNQGIPTIGGFVSEGRRSEAHRPPTLIVNQRWLSEVTSLVGRTYFAPPRAVGYRLWTSEDPDQNAGCRIVVEQAFWGAGAPGASSRDASNATVFRGNSNELDVDATGSNASQRATRNVNDWTLLLPYSIGITVGITFDSGAGARASLNLAGVTANVNTVIEAVDLGTAGDGITMRFVADGVGAGSLTHVGLAYTFHYQDAVTTVANFETAVGLDAVIRVKTPGTGANVMTAPGDTFGATHLAGGVEPLTLQVGVEWILDLG